MAVQNKQIAKHRQAMIVVLFACNLLASLMQSLMNVALDYVSAEYHVSLSEANLLVLGYSIVAGIVIVLAALSLHRFGLRKVMLFGLIVSFVGSMLGVVAWNFPSLVAARLIQAVATGLYFPVVNEALLNLSPKNGAGRLLAVNSGIIGIGLAVAPIVAGLVITYWGLRVLFAIPTVAAFVLFFIARRTIVDIMPRQKLPVDGLSVVLIAVGLSAFMIGLNEVTRNPLPMAALMIAGIVVCAWFIHRQGRLAHPLLDMRPLRNKTYALGRDPHRSQLYELNLPQSAHSALFGRGGGFHAVHRWLLAGSGDAVLCGSVLCQRPDAREGGGVAACTRRIRRVPCRVRGACGVHAARSCAGHRGLHGACVRGNRHRVSCD